MQCRVCGVQLPSNASVCTNCGTPVQYNDNNSYSGSGSNQPPVPPTVYGAPPPPPTYGQSGSYSPFEQPSAPSFNQGSGMNYPTQNANNFYPNSAPSSFPPTNQPGGFGTPFGQPPMTPRKKTPWGWIVVGVIVLVIIACVGSTLAINSYTANHSSSTPTPVVDNSTPTTSPSGAQIDPLAKSILYDPHLSYDIDEDKYVPKPGTETTHFQVDDYVYISYTANEEKMGDVSAQQPAYILAKFYADGQTISDKESPLVLKEPIDAGYDGRPFPIATKNGAVELYWCRKADCSDRKLALVAHFTVSDD